jgi:hypothetical protein
MTISAARLLTQLPGLQRFFIISPGSWVMSEIQGFAISVLLWAYYTILQGMHSSSLKE